MHSRSNFFSTIPENRKLREQILHDGKNFKGLYFSIEDMKNCMAAWPEIVLIDGTYRLNDLDFITILVMVEDSNGCSDIVAIAIIAAEELLRLHGC